MDITEYIVKQLTKGLIIIIGVMLIVGGLIGTVVGYFIAKW